MPEVDSDHQTEIVCVGLLDGGTALGGDECAGGVVVDLQVALVEAVEPAAADPAEIQRSRAHTPDVATTR